MSAVRSLFGPCWLGLRNSGIRPPVTTVARRDHLRAAQLERASGDEHAVDEPRFGFAPYRGALLDATAVSRERASREPAGPSRLASNGSHSAESADGADEGPLGRERYEVDGSLKLDLAGSAAANHQVADELVDARRVRWDQMHVVRRGDRARRQRDRVTGRCGEYARVAFGGERGEDAGHRWDVVVARAADRDVL